MARAVLTLLFFLRLFCSFASLVGISLAGWFLSNDVTKDIGHYIVSPTPSKWRTLLVQRYCNVLVTFVCSLPLSYASFYPFLKVSLTMNIIYEDMPLVHYIVIFTAPHYCLLRSFLSDFLYFFLLYARKLDSRAYLMTPNEFSSISKLYISCCPITVHFFYTFPDYFTHCMDFL